MIFRKLVLSNVAQWLIYTKIRRLAIDDPKLHMLQTRQTLMMSEAKQIKQVGGASLLLC
jgi:hypothetical protein